MEYYCQYCKDWEDAEYCESHYEMTHNQSGVTFDKLQTRMSFMGGLDTREAPPERVEKKPKSWMYREEIDPDAPIVTNNFKHNM